MEKLLHRLGKAPTKDDEIHRLIMEKLIPKWASSAGVVLSDLFNSSRNRNATLLRRRIAFLTIKHMGMTPTEAARFLQCSLPSICRAVDQYTECTSEECLNWFRVAIFDCQMLMPITRIA